MSYCGRLLAVTPLVDGVLGGDQQPQPDKAARRQNGQQQAGIGVEQLDAQGFCPLAQQQIGAIKQSTHADDFAHSAKHQQHHGKAQPHHQTVEGRQQRRVLGGIRLGAADDDAVGDNEGDKDAERLIEAIGVGVHQQLHAGHQRGDDHHVDRDADILRHPVAHQRDGEVGADQHCHGGKAEPQRIGKSGGDGEGRAQTQHLYQRGVVLPQPLYHQLLELALAAFQLGDRGGARFNLFHLCHDGSTPLLCGRTSRGVAEQFRMLVLQFQQVFHRFDHSPGGDGGAGKGIELAAILLHCPLGFIVGGQGFSGKAVDPVRFFQLDLVTKAGRLFVSEHSHRADGALGIKARHDADRPAVAIRRDRLQRIAGHHAILAGGIEGLRLIATQILPAGHQLAAGHQIVVIAAGRQQYRERLQLLQLLLVGDLVLGQLVGQHHQCGAAQREHGQDQAVLAHAL